MKKIKIIFQGDSITDAGRNREDIHNMGKGYPYYASEYINNDNPDIEFEFINQGISGNRTSQLFDRLYNDCIKLDPDIVSVLIGVNDVWHRYGEEKIATSDEQFALNYRSILSRIRRETNAKIMMISPYVLDADDKDFIAKDLPSVIKIVRELASEFADVYIPLDEHFEKALKEQPAPRYYSDDGVHPNMNGAQFIAKIYNEAIKPLLK